MRRKFLVLPWFALTACLSFAACDGGGTSGTGVGGSDGAAITISESSDGVPPICGHILDENGSGISGAIVESPFSGQEVLTDSDGSFIVDVSFSEPTLIVHTKNGVEQVYFSSEQGSLESQSFSLEAGEQISLTACSDFGSTVESEGAIAQMEEHEN